MQSSSRGLQRERLGVRRRVLPVLALVVPGAHDLALVHDNRADRDIVVRERLFGLRDRDRHEFLIHPRHCLRGE